MPNKLSRPSFIPASKESAGLPRSSRLPGLDPATTMGVLVFLLALTIWAGVVLYGQYIEAQTVVLEQRLRQEEEQLNRGVVDHLLDTDRQFTAAQTLIKQHLAPSYIFTILENRTVAGLRYTSFSYEFSPGSAVATVSLAGDAHNLGVVVRQTEILEQSPRIAASRFSQIDKQSEPPSGAVSFNLELDIPVAEIQYRNIPGLTDSSSAGNLEGTVGWQPFHQGELSVADR